MNKFVNWKMRAESGNSCEQNSLNFQFFDIRLCVTIMLRKNKFNYKTLCMVKRTLTLIFYMMLKWELKKGEENMRKNKLCFLSPFFYHHENFASNFSFYPTLSFAHLCRVYVHIIYRRELKRISNVFIISRAEKIGVSGMRCERGWWRWKKYKIFNFHFFTLTHFAVTRTDNIALHTFLISHIQH